MHYHAKTIPEILELLHVTKEGGLSTSEALTRLKQYGHNLLPQTKTNVSRLKIFLSQCKSPLVVILFVAGVVSGVVKEFSDMAIIFITVLVNTTIGFVQEDKANRALQKLSDMVDHQATVTRGGHIVRVPTPDVVPGDILHIEPGDSIAADGRIIEAIECEINEAPLTGESMPMKKRPDVLPEKLSLGDRINMVYRGTTVVNGKALVLVTATGAQTELGAIARLVEETPEEETPLQKELSKLARQIGIVVVVIVIGMLMLGWFNIGEQYSLLELFQTAIAMAVAAIPEALPISLTVILAIGMQFILKRQGLVRRLLAAETLGSVSVICTDKTGTLTVGSMQVTCLATMGETLDAHALVTFSSAEENQHRDARLALRIGAMANNASIENPDAPESEWHFTGDTTETALVALAQKAGIGKHHLDVAIPRSAEIPFTSERKFMATLHPIDHKSVIYAKGAPEIIFEQCSWYEHNGERKKITEWFKQWFKQTEKELAQSGLRLLAVAYKDNDALKETLQSEDMENLVCVGLIGLSDPVRADVPETIAQCKRAGIRVIMMTGDHRDTAMGIGRTAGFDVTDQNVIDAPTLEQMSKSEFDAALKDVAIFSRVNPSDKLRIVGALQRQGEVVAVTGDGVNDAPALKGADIGVAIGSGTDVAKETADLVLLNDSFTTIVAAIEEGRRIYQNLKKVILYLLAGSFSEIVLIVGSIAFRLPLAILPAQILWVNIIQETFPTISLAFDPGEKENMLEKPRRGSRQLLDSHMRSVIAAMSIIPNTMLLGLFFFILRSTGDLPLARTLMFAGITVGSVFYVYAIRSKRYHLWQKNPFDNWRLNVAVLLGGLLFLGAVYLPPLQKLLQTVPLDAYHWALLIGFGLINIFVIEIMKAIFKKKLAYGNNFSF